MEKRNIPALRFPEFQGEWKKTKLGLAARINPKSESLPNSFIYIDLESVNSGSLDKEERIEKDNAPSRAQRLLEFNDILYQTVRPYQKNNYFFKKHETDYVASTGYAQIRTTNSSQFIYQLLHTDNFVNKVLLRCTGTSYPSINSSDLAKIPLNLPLLPEQQKIASFLTEVDTKLQGLKRKKELLEQYKKGIMQKLFSQALRFKDENGQPYPNWEKKRLGEVGEFKNGINKSKEDFGFGHPFINLMDVFGKPTISDLNLEKVNASPKELEAYELKKGDVLFIRSSVKREGVGETSLILENLNNTVYSGFLIRFRDVHNPLDFNFKKYCFANLVFRRSLLALSTTSANTNINQESLNELQLGIPSLPEQTKIANFLTAIDQKIEQLSQQIAKVETWKKGLLQKMFV